MSRRSTRRAELHWDVRLGLVIVVVAACTRAASSNAPVPVAMEPADVIDTLPPRADLSGAWATGNGPEPSVASVTLHPPCTHHPASWVLQQRGNVVEAWAFPESFDQGIAVRDPPLARVRPAKGTMSGVDLTLSDGSSRYVLKYDEASGHLRGTLNGRPFWAVRQVVVRTEACPGVP
jgi:hypothetical protein